MKTLTVGIVSDEISADFREAVRYGTAWGITRYELRCLKTGRVPAVEEAEREGVVRTARERRLQITALSPGVFKHPLSNMTEIEHEVSDTLPATISMAKECGASMIIVFGFRREPGEPPGNFATAVAVMRRAAVMARKENLGIAIENEPGFWCDTGENTRRFIRAVDSPAVGANWDPCNSYGTDEVPYPDGYEAVKSAVVNVHVKDTKKGSLIECVPVGEGVIDWEGQIGALARDGIVEHVTIETHCLPLIENSRRNVETLRAMIDRLTRKQKQVS